MFCKRFFPAGFFPPRFFPGAVVSFSSQSVAGGGMFPRGFFPGPFFAPRFFPGTLAAFPSVGTPDKWAVAPDRGATIVAPRRR